MLTITTDRPLFRQTVIAWLNQYADLSARIIWANQSTPRPAKPYGSVLFVSTAKTGFDEERANFNVVDDVIERVTTGPRQITAQVEVYTDPAASPNAIEAAERLENALLALDTVAVRDLFRAAKIGVLGHSAVQRMDDQLGERWERRAVSEVIFTYSGETFDDGDTTGNWIETVEAPTEANGNADYD